MTQKPICLVEPDVDELGRMGAALRKAGQLISLFLDWADLEAALGAAVPSVLILSDRLPESLADLQQRSLPWRQQHDVLFLTDEASESPPCVSRWDLPGTIAHIQRLANGASKAVRRHELRGTLGDVTLPDLVQLLVQNQRSGTLSITSSVGSGEVRFTDGDLVDSVFRNLEAEKALFRMLALDEGAFVFMSGRPSALRRFTTSTAGLLLEGARVSDELKQLRSQLPAPTALLQVAPGHAPSDPLDSAIAEQLTVPGTLDTLLDALSWPDLQIAARVVSLWQRASLREVAPDEVAVPLGTSEQLAVMTALLQRRGLGGFAAPPRVLLTGSNECLRSVAQGFARLAGAVLHGESALETGLPGCLGELHLDERNTVQITRLPVHDHLAPLWSLMIPGALIVIRLVGGESRALEACCEANSVPVCDALELVGELDSASPRQLASLLRSALMGVAS